MKYLMITLTLLSKVGERILSHYFNIHNFFMALLGCDSFNVDSMISNVFNLQLQRSLQTVPSVKSSGADRLFSCSSHCVIKIRTCFSMEQLRKIDFFVLFPILE